MKTITQSPTMALLLRLSVFGCVFGGFGNRLINLYKKLILFVQARTQFNHLIAKIILQVDSREVLLKTTYHFHFLFRKIQRHNYIRFLRLLSLLFPHRFSDESLDGQQRSCGYMSSCCKPSIYRLFCYTTFLSEPETVFSNYFQPFFDLFLRWHRSKNM